MDTPLGDYGYQVRSPVGLGVGPSTACSMLSPRWPHLVTPSPIVPPPDDYRHDMMII
jgi:hypothetical protein